MDGGPMLRFKFLISLALFVTSSAFAGTWTKINPNTLSFTGPIEHGEFAKFQKIYSSDIQALVVRSGGGVAVEGLFIGEVLAQNPELTVIVQGYCMSSCANYLFVAGKTKFLDYGIVGFHGNLHSTIFINEKQKKFMKDLEASNPQKAAQERAAEDEMDRREAAFLRLVKVSQDLFDKSDLLAQEGLFNFYAPSRLKLMEFGIGNVNGEQFLPEVIVQNNIRVFIDKDKSN
jgi:hypothetical protein